MYVNSYFWFCIYPVLHFYQYNLSYTSYNIFTSYLLIGMWGGGVQKCHEGSFYFVPGGPSFFANFGSEVLI